MATGSAEDFTEFYQATWSRTVACAYAIGADLGTAEEVAQEAYSRAWSRWRTLRRYDDPGAWVRQVAGRLAISRWRRLRTAATHLARSRPPEPTAAPSESSVALAAALKTLPESQRRAIVLHHLADLPIAEIAVIEGCPGGTVKARLSRGRTALAAALDPTISDPTTDLEDNHA